LVINRILAKHEMFMETRALEHLLALGEHRHFGRAAKALGVTQPALSKSIQRLEKVLGAQLLDRSRRGVVPTAIGAQVIERARPLVGHVADLQREVDLLRGRSIGRLAIGVGPAMAESFVTTAVARLATHYPRAQIKVRVDHWSQLSHWLKHGEIDLFVADITQAVRDVDLQAVPLRREQMLWFCRREHPLAASRRLTRKDLLAHPLATPKMPEWARRWFAEAADPDAPFDHDRTFSAVECESYAMLKRVVLASDCISAALASTISGELQAGNLVTLPIKAPTLHTKAGVVRLRGRSLSPLGEAFVHETMRASEEAVAPRGV
jgi:DNA-binding transcriptional LysR family regulator